MTAIRSSDNPRVKRWAKLASDPRFRKSEQRVLIEGPHLVAEALQAGLQPLALIVSESGLKKTEIKRLIGELEPVVLGDRVFGIVADAETPPGIAAEIEVPRISQEPGGPAVFLEGLQDPANVGAILRSAAAFGVGEVILDRGCADPWSPKVLRAAIGAHFKLALQQVADLEKSVVGFEGTTVCTVSSGGTPVESLKLQGRVGWIFGSEGRGVSPGVAAKAKLKGTIRMTPASESLNVAAAAAICLYETYSRAAAQ
jgi:TrmH family RNA methyltransferase